MKTPHDLIRRARLLFACATLSVPAGAATTLTGALPSHLALSQSPYIISDSPYDPDYPEKLPESSYIPAGQTTTVEPGVILKIAPYSTLEVFGTLQLLGVSTQPITVTALYDGSSGEGDLAFRSGSAGAFNYVDLRYTSLSLEESTVTMRNSFFGYTSYGVYVDYGVIDVQNSVIDSANRALSCYRSSCTISTSNIYGYVDLTPLGLADARNNFWGWPTGPTHVSNPGGQGAGAGANVLVLPFLSAPAGVQLPPVPDTLPPQTRIFIPNKAPVSRTIIVSTSTRISLFGLDDRTHVGDGQGVGIQQTSYRINTGAAVPYADPFTLPGGSHTLSYWSLDQNNHQELPHSLSILVDSSPPVSTIYFFPRGYVDASSRTFVSPKMSANWLVDELSTVSSIHYSFDGITFSTTTFYTPVEQGTHTLTYFATDFFGLTESPKTMSWTTDSAPPKTKLVIQPNLGQFPDGSYWITPTSAISLETIDPSPYASGVKLASYTLDSNGYVVNGGTFSIPSLGGHTLSFDSVDNVGNVEPRQQVRLTCTNGSPPITTLTHGTPFYIDASSGLYVSSNTPLGFSVDDRGSPPVVTNYRVDKGSFQVFSSSFTLPHGRHVIDVYSQTASGNTEATHSFAVGVDTMAPSVQITFMPEATAGNVISLSTSSFVTVVTTDPISGIQSIVYQVDGATIPYADPFSLTQGTHTLAFVLTDHLFNVATVAPFSVAVSSMPPDLAGNSDPTAIRLPDGTLVVASPATVEGPYAVNSSGPVSPDIEFLEVYPTPPLPPGLFSVYLRYKTPYPKFGSVSLRAAGSATSTRLTGSSAGNSDWSGYGEITTSMRAGPATLTVSGTKDGAGRTLPTAIFTVDIGSFAVVPAPKGLTVIERDTRAELSWQAVHDASYYKVFRGTYPFTSPPDPRDYRFASTPFVFEVPYADVPRMYYAVATVNSAEVQSPLSALVSIGLPLTPSVVSPPDGSSVDPKAIVLSGRSLAYTGVEVTLAGSTQTIATGEVSVDGDFSIPLSLSAGSNVLHVRARGLSTGLLSGTTTWVLNVLGAVPPVASLKALPGDTTITLQWVPEATAGIVGFNVYRDGAHVPLNGAPIPVGQTSWRDTALRNKRTYQYAVTAVAGTGLESAPSKSVVATPVAGPEWP